MPTEQSRRAMLVDINQARRLSDFKLLPRMNDMSEFTDAPVPNCQDGLSPLAKEPAVMQYWTLHINKK